MKSLDPRVNRIPIQDQPLAPKAPLDQFGTYEAFIQLREDKPYIHAGAVHAPNPEMAFLFAKEQFSRRQTCTGLFVADTRKVYVTEMTEGKENVYARFAADPYQRASTTASYEIFHLYRRGKQHEHIGSVEAGSPQHALMLARQEFLEGDPVLNVWVIPTDYIRFSTEGDKILWDTLPEKSFREATDYKASDKLRAFKDQKNES